MPSDGPTLSEKLQDIVAEMRAVSKYLDEEAMFRWIERIEEAARLLAPFGQPEVAMLLAPEVAMLHRKAVLLERDGFPERAEECRGHVRALVELAEAQAKLKRVAGLLQQWHTCELRWGIATGREHGLLQTLRAMRRALCEQVDAALASADQEREVTG